MRTIKVTDIKYDTDGEIIDLPETLEIELPDDLKTDEEISDFVSDEISNKTGFCHFGFSIPEIDNK